MWTVQWHLAFNVHTDMTATLDPSWIWIVIPKFIFCWNIWIPAYFGSAHVSTRVTLLSTFDLNWSLWWKKYFHFGKPLHMNFSLDASVFLSLPFNLTIFLMFFMVIFIWFGICSYLSRLEYEFNNTPIHFHVCSKCFYNERRIQTCIK